MPPSSPEQLRHRDSATVKAFAEAGVAVALADISGESRTCRDPAQAAGGHQAIRVTCDVVDDPSGGHVRAHRRRSTMATARVGHADRTFGGGGAEAAAISSSTSSPVKACTTTPVSARTASSGRRTGFAPGPRRDNRRTCVGGQRPGHPLTPGAHPRCQARHTHESERPDAVAVVSLACLLGPNDREQRQLTRRERTALRTIAESPEKSALARRSLRLLADSPETSR